MKKIIEVNEPYFVVKENCNCPLIVCNYSHFLEFKKGDIIYLKRYKNECIEYTQGNSTFQTLTFDFYQEKKNIGFSRDLHSVNVPKFLDVKDFLTTYFFTDRRKLLKLLFEYDIFQKRPLNSYIVAISPVVQEILKNQSSNT